jgi:hypothetical protein
MRAEIQAAKAEVLAEMYKLDLKQIRWTAVMMLLVMLFALVMAIPRR